MAPLHWWWMLVFIHLCLFFSVNCVVSYNWWSRWKVCDLWPCRNLNLTASVLGCWTPFSTILQCFSSFKMRLMRPVQSTVWAGSFDWIYWTNHIRLMKTWWLSLNHFVEILGFWIFDACGQWDVSTTEWQISRIFLRHYFTNGQQIFSNEDVWTVKLQLKSPRKRSRRKITSFTLRPKHTHVDAHTNVTYTLIRKFVNTRKQQEMHFTAQIQIKTMTHTHTHTRWPTSKSNKNKLISRSICSIILHVLRRFDLHACTHTHTLPLLWDTFQSDANEDLFFRNRITSSAALFTVRHGNRSPWRRRQTQHRSLVIA